MPRLRSFLGTLLSAALTSSGLAVVLVGASAPPASAAPTPVCDANGQCTVTFDYTGAVETWTVPAGVTSITATVEGAGTSSAGGGRSTGTTSATPGATVTMVIGGTNGYGGGGAGGVRVPYSGRNGSGGSFLAVNGVLLLVAGGAGGAGGGAGGGGSSGGVGGGAGAPAGDGATGVTGVGKAATATAHGAGGGDGAGSGSGSFGISPSVTVPQGGKGGDGVVPCGGGGMCFEFSSGGGGGGGGYFAGGGAAGSGTDCCGPRSSGGGGGSGYAAASLSNVSGAAGVRNGNGRIVITYTPKIAQTISFTSSPSSRTVGSTYEVSATGGGSGNPVVFSVGGSPSGTCSIVGSRVTFDHVGQCLIHADQVGSSRYLDASRATQTVTVTQAAQEVFLVSAGVTQVGRTAQMTFTSGGSGNPVVVTVTSTNGVCAVNGTTISYLKAGSCHLDLDQAGNADYAAAFTTNLILAVSPGSQAISGLSLPPAPRVGDTASLSASGGASGRPVTYASSSSACTVSGSTVSFVHVGSCAVTASQAGTADYAAASDVTVSTTVGQRLQTISFSLPTAGKVGGDASLSAVASAGGAVSYAAGGDAGVCRIVGSSVVYDRAGSCTVTASQAGNDDVAAAPEVSQTVVVGKGLQSISFVIPGPNSVGGSRNLGATGGASGQPVTFAVAAGTTNDACVIQSGRVVFRHAGTCVVTADQAGTDDYEPAATATHVVTVAKAAAGLAVTAPAAATVGESLVLVPRSDSPAPVSAVSDRPDVCSVVGLTVTFDHVGTCIVLLTQPETADYLAGSTGMGAITVGKAAQVISGFAPGGSGVVGGGVDLSASGGGSGNSVTFAVSDETTNGACTISSGPAGSTVSFVHAGSCVVTADQAGNSDYTAAVQVKRTIVVGKASQVISGFSLPGSAVIGSQFDLVATGGAGGAPVVFSVASGTTNEACRVVAGRVLVEHAGTCVVAADQAGTADYTAASQVVQAVAVARNPQSLVFSLPATASLGGSAPLVATGGASGQSVVFSVAAATTNGACVIDGAVVRFVHAGSCVIEAFQGGTADFEEARTLATVGVERAATVTSVSVTGSQIRALVRSTDASLGSVVGTPSGQVQFLLDGVLLGAATLNAEGVAVLDAVIPAGERLVVARYLGDGDFAAGVGDFATSSGEVVRTDPVITATVTSTRRISSSGWYRSPVTVSFVCVAGSGAVVGACPSPVVIGRSTKGRAVTGTVLAEDGGRATVTTEVLRVDVKRPKVRITGIAAGNPRCVAKDKTSGVASCRLKVRTHRDRVVYIAIARDVAGNTSRVKKTVRR